MRRPERPGAQYRAVSAISPSSTGTRARQPATLRADRVLAGTRRSKITATPNLNVMLCLQMNYPPIATAPVDTCIYHLDFSSYKDFAEVPCGSANSYVSGHFGTYDPSQC